MSDFLTSAVTAVLARLAADSGLQALLGTPARVVDQATLASVFPYLKLAQVETRDASLKGQAAVQVILTLHALSRGRTGDEARRILSALRECLHDASFTLSTGTLARCQEEFSACTSDREMTLGTARYRLLVTT